MLILKLLAATVIASVITISTCSIAIGKDEFSTSPKTNNGQKWKIGYYEGGAHDNYYDYLAATINGLIDLGWIEPLEIPQIGNKSTKDFWNWLSDNVDSDYIEFIDNFYYSSNWDGDIRNEMKTGIIARVNEKKDVDLIIAMGTWAGKDLANDMHSTPTIVMSASDPVKSGIIKNINDSGYDHVHARVDPQRYERQVQIFHDIVDFKKLGVAYEDSVYGRSYAAIDLIEKVAKERDFEIIKCFTQSDIVDRDLAGESVVECFQELARNADAIYVTVQGGVNSVTIPKLVQIANKYRIPTFSQLGSEEVRYGFFLSISRAGGFKPVGVFLAATIAKIFNGAKPRNLNQVFKEAPNIAINLKTAEHIGLYLYADVLAAADEIYREIEIPK